MIPGELCGLEEDDVKAFTGEDRSGVGTAWTAAYDENLGVLEMGW